MRSRTARRYSRSALAFPKIGAKKTVFPTDRCNRYHRRIEHFAAFGPPSLIIPPATIDADLLFQNRGDAQDIGVARRAKWNAGGDNDALAEHCDTAAMRDDHRFLHHFAE